MKRRTIIETKNESGENKKPGASKRKHVGKEIIIKGLRTLQHVSPRLTSSIIWSQFTKTPRARFNDPQKALIAKAEKRTLSYQGFELVSYRWVPDTGAFAPRILLSHGWGSKIADFRRMIEMLVEKGFVVEGIDMKGHGHSAGTHTALPEIRDVLKSYYAKEGPFHAVIGYSIGGLAAGITINELSATLHPKHLIIIATPPYTRYFFKEIIEQVGCNEQVYDEMCGLVYDHYFQPIDYFDLRNKGNQLQNLDLHMIYDELDKTVPFAKGLELNAAIPSSSFVQVKGTDHNKIIADDQVIAYILNAVQTVGSSSQMAS